MANQEEFPPLLNERDRLTGLISNVKYVFNEDGTINWRKMVKPEFLAVNSENFTRKGLSAPESIEGVEDRDLIILLAGLKDLARIRGFSKIDPVIKTACPDYAAAECRITWLPHRDVGGEVQQTGGNAMATLNNTEGFTKYYLVEIAQNRAFARCVRDYLGINIVSKEEISQTPEGQSSNLVSEGATDAKVDPHTLLQRAMDEKKVTFDDLKAKLIKENFLGAENYASIHDIPVFKVLALTKRVKAKKD